MVFSQSVTVNGCKTKWIFLSFLFYLLTLQIANLKKFNLLKCGIYVTGKAEARHDYRTVSRVFIIHPLRITSGEPCRTNTLLLQPFLSFPNPYIPLLTTFSVLICPCMYKLLFPCFVWLSSLVINNYSNRACAVIWANPWKSNSAFHRVLILLD